MFKEISIPDEWGNVYKTLEKEKGLAIILGMPDAGKSTEEESF
ncbi:MAG: hypothetical protein AABY78_04905 [Nitrospirota bacterium]